MIERMRTMTADTITAMSLAETDDGDQEEWNTKL
jgi:hypothetical protein